MSLSLPSVTLVAVTGLPPQSALYALWRSQRDIRFAAVKLISPVAALESADWFTAEVPQFEMLESIDSYNRFMIYHLWRHVQTEHVLVVQADGYVLDHRMWDPAFLKFDYIGAPWKVSRTAYIDPFGVHQRVGNGGFSLRSRRLLELPRWVDVPFDVNSNDFYNHMNVGLSSEDGNICVHNRHIFEMHGCKFADLETACRFSKEQPITQRRFRSTFGFHKHIPVRHKLGERRQVRQFLSLI